MAEKTAFKMESSDEQGNTLSVSVEGTSDMAFWKHDLKIEAVKALLETVDKKDFYEDGKEDEFHKSIQELRNLLNSLEM
ncbi:hypothetical protein [Niallia sp. 03133]|uniref:hypothetical protein n=1 Tax=Niallia sp. 03133 TaxID=3458060 RepID=UPI004043B71C